MEAGEIDGIEVTTGPTVELAVIWLHGLGADGRDFEPIVPALQLPCGVRFVFPHAPVRPVTINGGYPMRAWYDILSLDRSAREDADGIRASAAELVRLVGRERSRGLACERIVLAGFSQGGAIALYTGLTMPEQVGGVLALSTYLPLADEALAFAGGPGAAGPGVFEQSGGATSTGGHGSLRTTLPIWMGHGTLDPVIDVSLAEHSRDRLLGAGFRVDWHAYPMPHTVSMEEIVDISRWLGRFG